MSCTQHDLPIITYVVLAGLAIGHELIGLRLAIGAGIAIAAVWIVVSLGAGLLGQWRLQGTRPPQTGGAKLESLR